MLVREAMADAPGLGLPARHGGRRLRDRRHPVLQHHLRPAAAVPLGPAEDHPLRARPPHEHGPRRLRRGRHRQAGLRPAGGRPDLPPDGGAGAPPDGEGAASRPRGAGRRRSWACASRRRTSYPPSGSPGFPARRASGCRPSCSPTSARTAASARTTWSASSVPTRRTGSAIIPRLLRYAADRGFLRRTGRTVHEQVLARLQSGRLPVTVHDAADGEIRTRSGAEMSREIVEASGGAARAGSRPRPPGGPRGPQLQPLSLPRHGHRPLGGGERAPLLHLADRGDRADREGVRGAAAARRGAGRARPGRGAARAGHDRVLLPRPGARGSRRVGPVVGGVPGPRQETRARPRRARGPGRLAAARAGGSVGPRHPAVHLRDHRHPEGGRLPPRAAAVDGRDHERAPPVEGADVPGPVPLVPAHEPRGGRDPRRLRAVLRAGSGGHHLPRGLPRALAGPAARASHDLLLGPPVLREGLGAVRGKRRRAGCTAHSRAPRPVPRCSATSRGRCCGRRSSARPASTGAPSSSSARRPVPRACSRASTSSGSSSTTPSASPKRPW